MVSDGKKKSKKISTTKKKKKAKKKKSAVVAKPKPIVKNRFVFRDQLDANGCDLVGEILKNIALIECVSDRLDYLMRLLPYGYNKLDAVQMLQPIDPSRGVGEAEKKGGDIIEGEILNLDNKGEFDDILKNI